MKSIWVLLAVVVILAAGLRFYAIGAKGLWLDEALSWRLQSFPLDLMLERTGESSTVHPPLYFALLRAWTACFGDSESALRSFSALAGVFTVLATFLLATDLTLFAGTSLWKPAGRAPWCVGLLAAALVALSPFHVYLARQARGYCLGTLFFALSSWALVRGLQAETKVSVRRFWILYAILALAFCYTHHLAIFSITAQCVFLALYLSVSSRPSRRSAPVSIALGTEPCANDVTDSLAGGYDSLMLSRRMWASIAMVLLVLGYLPWLSRLWAQSQALRTSWTKSLTLESCARELFAALFATSGVHPKEPIALSWAVAFALLAVLTYVAVRFGWGGIFLLLVGIVPVWLNVSYSALSSRSIFDARYLAFAQVGWLIALALAAVSLSSRLERSFAVVALLLLTLDGLKENWSLFGPESNPGVRGAIAYIEEHRREGEPIVAMTPFVFFQMSYYMRASSPPVLCVVTRDRQAQRGAAQLLDDDLATRDQILGWKSRDLWVVTSDSYDPSVQTDLMLPPTWRTAERAQFAPEQHIPWEKAVVVTHCHQE